MAIGRGRVADREPQSFGYLRSDWPYAQANASHLDAALAAARRAQPVWWAAGIPKRHNVLMAIGTELMARAQEIGRLLSREEGKLLAEGRCEIYRASQFFTYFTGKVLRQHGDRAESVRPGIEIDLRRAPVGVLAIINPWSFPVATPARKVAPALTFGNAVVWKPANVTPAIAIALTEIIARQDILKALFNLVAAARALKVGHALEDGAQIGPVVSERQLAQNLGYLETGNSDGAELLCGGDRLERATDGYFTAPAVFAQTRNDTQINREDRFAPVTCVQRADSFDEALNPANNSQFGLTAGIMTRSLARASHFRVTMRAGCVMVNLPASGSDYYVLFVECRASSFGPREQGA